MFEKPNTISSFADGALVALEDAHAVIRLHLRCVPVNLAMTPWHCHFDPLFLRHFGWVLLGCIYADFWKEMLIFQEGRNDFGQYKNEIVYSSRLAHTNHANTPDILGTADISRFRNATPRYQIHEYVIRPRVPKFRRVTTSIVFFNESASIQWVKMQSHAISKLNQLEPNYGSFDHRALLLV